jgi:CRISPR-associated protein Cmr6
VRKVRTRSRLLLHPDSPASVTEGNILLHHTYGVPYLPGTALKGVCRAYACRLAKEKNASDILSPPGGALGNQWVEQLFGDEPTSGGDSRSASLFDFWDALWVPPAPGRSREKGPLALDVVNPHHGDYYTKGSDNDRRPPPAEWDAPIPTHRLTVAPNAHFLIRVEAPESTAVRPWLDWVVDKLLLPALDFEGVGSRTTSGYGRLVAADAVPGTRGAAAGAGEADRGTAPASLSRTRNDGALHATFDDGKLASLRGERAQELYRGLSEAVRKRIDKNRPVVIQVTWVKIGNARSIEGLQESG